MVKMEGPNCKSRAKCTMLCLTWHPRRYRGEVSASNSFSYWIRGKMELGLKQGVNSAKPMQINYIVVYNNLIAISIQSCYITTHIKLLHLLRHWGLPFLFICNKNTSNCQRLLSSSHLILC